MFKLILGISVISGCGILGIVKASSFSQRLRELTDFRDILTVLNTEISYMKDPLPVIFERISSGGKGISCSILTRCCFYMDKRLPFDVCWSKAVDETVSGTCLSRSDIAVIKDLGSQLGKSSVKGQTDVISMTEEKIMHQIREAREEKNTKGRMYGGLGFSMGVVISVLLI